jgi:hypothetical protein
LSSRSGDPNSADKEEAEALFVNFSDGEADSMDLGDVERESE